MQTSAGTRAPEHRPDAGIVLEDIDVQDPIVPLLVDGALGTHSVFKALLNNDHPNFSQLSRVGSSCAAMRLVKLCGGAEFD